MAIYHAIDILTSKWVLLPVRAASGFNDDCQMSVLSDVFGGYIGSFMVDFLVSALLLCTLK